MHPHPMKARPKETEIREIREKPDSLSSGLNPKNFRRLSWPLMKASQPVREERDLPMENVADL